MNQRQSAQLSESRGPRATFTGSEHSCAPHKGIPLRAPTAFTGVMERCSQLLRPCFCSLGGGPSKSGSPRGRRAATCSGPTRALRSSSVQASPDLGRLILEGRKATSVAHEVWRRVVRPGDRVLDATCGNGHDTLALARMALRGGGEGQVVAVDSQQGAVERTKALLEAHLSPSELERVRMECLCHAHLASLAGPASLRLVAFNLGYLPGGSKEVTTEQSTTLAALDAAVHVVAPGGLVSVVAYVGHPQAFEEYAVVRQFASALSPREWVCCVQEGLNRPLAPRLLLMHRKAAPL